MRSFVVKPFIGTMLAGSALTVKPASVDRNPEGEDRNGLRAKHESAAPKADAKP